MILHCAGDFCSCDQWLQFQACAIFRESDSVDWLNTSSMSHGASFTFFPSSLYVPFISSKLGSVLIKIKPVGWSSECALSVHPVADFSAGTYQYRSIRGLSDSLCIICPCWWKKKCERLIRTCICLIAVNYRGDLSVQVSRWLSYNQIT